MAWHRETVRNHWQPQDLRPIRAAISAGAPPERKNLPGTEADLGMTIVNGTRPGRPAGPTPTRPRAGSGDFRLTNASLETETPAAPASASAVSGIALGGLLAMQEGAPGSVRDREARRHGRLMLDALRDLQRAFLAAESPHAAAPSPAARLAELAAQPPAADDPALAGILRAIAVRTAVELARRAPPSSERG